MKKKFIAVTVAAMCVGIAIGAVSAGLIDDIDAQIRRDFTIVIDGKTQTFKNANGETVYPVLYDGTTYLPVRAIGELMGKTVYWYEDDKRIELKDSGTTVTDADVIYDGTASGKTETGKTEIGVEPGRMEPGKVEPGKVEPGKIDAGKIDKTDITAAAKVTLQEAKEIAYAKAAGSANIDEAVLTLRKAKLDMDDGKLVYEIEFVYDNVEYEAEISADDGSVIKWEVEALNKAANSAEAKITLEKAKDIALKKAGLKESDVTFKKAKLDTEDGITVYEIEFTYGRTEYEAEINAADGTVLKWEIDED